MDIADCARYALIDIEIWFLIHTNSVIGTVAKPSLFILKNPNVRKYLAERAELVGAVRLPVEVFRGNAGTEVTSDILFFQKREKKIAVEPDWVHLGVTWQFFR